MGNSLSPLIGNPFEDNAPTVQGRIFRFILHFFVATIVSAVIGIIVIARLDTGPSHHQGLLLTLLIGSQYSPILFVPGFFIGLVINDRMGSRSALWVGPVCVVLLFILVLGDIWSLSHSGYYRAYTQGHYLHYEYGQLFSLDNRDCGNTECLGKLLAVPPVLRSIAYSAGAWLALRRKNTQIDAKSTR
jgi:hypothetical protein